MKKVFLSVLMAAAGAAASYSAAAYREKKRTSLQKDYSDKHLRLYLMMKQWVQVKQENRSIADHLEKKGYKDIAIYGMNHAGETLLRELAGTPITVRYGIDRNAEAICSDIEVIRPDDKMEDVDAVIVTAVTYFDEIEGMLAKRVDRPILSLEDILYEI